MAHKNIPKLRNYGSSKTFLFSEFLGNLLNSRKVGQRIGEIDPRRLRLATVRIAKTWAQITGSRCAVTIYIFFCNFNFNIKIEYDKIIYKTRDRNNVIPLETFMGRHGLET